MSFVRFCVLATPVLIPLVLSILLPSAVPAQSYHVRTYTEQDGLPCYAVMGVAQDGAGQMWFATNDGMVCYDGVSWTTHSQKQGLWRKGHRATVTSASGGIWAVDVRSPIALSYYDGDQWSRIPVPDHPSQYWWEIVSMSAGQGRDRREHVAVATAQGLVCFWNGEDWLTAGPATALKNVSALVFHDGLAYAATPAGLWSIDPCSGVINERVADGIPDGAVLGVTGSRDADSLWLIGRDWLGKIRDGSCELICTELDIEFTTMRLGVSALEDQLGGLYFGDAASLYYFHDSCSVEVLARENGLSSDGVGDILLDREGNIWITSMRGVSKIISRRFAGYSHLQGLFKDEVCAIHQRRSGEIVLGHATGLTFLEDEPRILAFDDNPGKTGRVTDIEEDDAGNLWLACDRLGLGRLDPGENLTWYREGDGLPGFIYAVHIDRNGRFWVGTIRGLYEFTNDDFVKWELPGEHLGEPLPVRRITEGPDGSVFVATRRYGVYRVRGNTITRWIDPDYLGGDDAFCANAFADDIVWVGTANGLFEIAGDRMVKTTPPRPVIDRPIYSMLQDNKGRIWFGTDAGVMRWDGNDLEHFTVQDGLYGRETNRDALVLADDGNIWIGTDSGLWVYREKFDLPTLATPVLEILEIEVDGRLYPVEQTLVLDAPATQIIFRFRGVSFLDEDRTRFQTWLENFQPDFEPPRLLPHQEVRYTNVAPGKYRFHVQAVGVDDRASILASTGWIEIHPVFWQRWWAYLLYVLLGVTVVWAVISYLTKRRYAMVLEKEVQARTEKLQESERAVKIESRKLETTLVSISDGVLALDRNREILLVNPAAENLLGVTSREIEGYPLSSIMDGVFEPEDSPTNGDGKVIDTPDTLLAAIGSGEPRLFKHIPSNCPLRYLEISSATMYGPDDRELGTVLAFRDVTAKRQLEHELTKRQKLESLGLLAGGIAHDFNNLLTVIQGYLALSATETVESEEKGQYNEMALQATQSAQQLTQQLLTFAKGGTPKCQVVAIDEVVHESARLAMSGSGMDCRIEMAADLRPVKADPGQIAQVVGNLLMNARQAMGDSGTIHVTSHNHSDDGTRPEVAIVIRDEGPGISEPELLRVFDPYYTTKETGSGLGLAIVYSIIEKHHGRLAVATELGCGTTFSVYLPATKELPRTITKHILPADLGGGNVLLLDDEKYIRVVTTRMLQHLGFACEAVQDGHEVIVAYQRALRENRPYAAVILDLTVPGGMGGMETCTRLREIDPDVCAIVSSGYSDDPVLSEFQRFGFAGRLEKPYDIEHLGAALLNAVQTARRV